MWGRMESFDYANRYFEQFNGSVPDRDKIREINAAFAQGRMYFENAKSADLSVKPVFALLRSHGSGCRVGVLQAVQDRRRFNEAIPRVAIPRLATGAGWWGR